MLKTSRDCEKDLAEFRARAIKAFSTADGKMEELPLQLRDIDMFEHRKLPASFAGSRSRPEYVLEDFQHLKEERSRRTHDTIVEAICGFRKDLSAQFQQLDSRFNQVQQLINRVRQVVVRLAFSSHKFLLSQNDLSPISAELERCREDVTRFEKTSEDALWKCYENWAIELSSYHDRLSRELHAFRIRSAFERHPRAGFSPDFSGTKLDIRTGPSPADVRTISFIEGPQVIVETKPLIKRGCDVAGVVIKLGKSGIVGPEAEVLQLLNHPNIVRCVGTTQDPYFGIVLEDCELGDMWELVRGGYKLTVAQCSAIAVGLLRAIAHLVDNRIIHGDIKLDNVFFSLAGLVKLADFDSAIRLSPGQRTAPPRSSNQIVKLPEQALILEKSDTFSAGVVILSLSVPHAIKQTDDLTRFISVATKASKHFGATVSQMLNPTAEKRPSCKELIANFEALVPEGVDAVCAKLAKNINEYNQCRWKLKQEAKLKERDERSMVFVKSLYDLPFSQWIPEVNFIWFFGFSFLIGFLYILVFHSFLRFLVYTLAKLGPQQLVCQLCCKPFPGRYFSMCSLTLIDHEQQVESEGSSSIVRYVFVQQVMEDGTLRSFFAFVHPKCKRNRPQNKYTVFRSARVNDVQAVLAELKRDKKWSEDWIYTFSGNENRWKFNGVSLSMLEMIMYIRQQRPEYVLPQ